MGGVAIGGLGDGAEPELGQVELESVEQAGRVAAAHVVRRRRRGRSARATRCPGGTPRRAPPGRPGGGRGSRGRAATRDRSPTEVTRSSRQAATICSIRRGRSRGRTGERPPGAGWVVVRRPAVPVGSTDVGQPGRAEGEPRLEGGHRLLAQGRPRVDRPGPTRPSRSAALPSALIQSASISTGNPARGVTGRPSIRASIQVSAQPSAPRAAGRSRCRRRCRTGCRPRARPGSSTTVADSSAARSRSPVRATCRPSACRNQSVASMVLYSSVPTSAVLASIPSDTLAAARCSTARPSSWPAGAQEQALVRREQVARPLPEPRVARDGRRPVRASVRRTGRRRRPGPGRRRRSAPARTASASALARASATIDAASGEAASSSVVATTPSDSPAERSARKAPAAQRSSLAPRPRAASSR